MPARPSIPFNTQIESLPATTPFVGPEAIERERGRPFALRLGANESLFGPSPLVLEAIRTAAPQVALYGDPENWELRQAISKREDVSSDRVVIGSGIDDLLGTLIRVLLNPGDIAVASLGAYPTVGFHMAGYGAHLEHVPYREFHNDLDQLAHTARRARARLVYLANPDNPTGTYVSGSDISHLLAQLPDECAFLLDEAYTEFAPAGCRDVTPGDDPRLIRLRTFSKAYSMAGARIGYALVTEEIARMIEKVRLHFGVNRLAQIGAVAALGDQAYVESIVAEVARGRDEYAALGRDLGLSPIESATNFVAFDTGSPERARALAVDLEQHDVFVRRPGAGPTRLVRVTVCDGERRQRFASVFRESCAAIERIASNAPTRSS
jgi:histidinol-phosphate aminotransferase